MATEIEETLDAMGLLLSAAKVRWETRAVEKYKQQLRYDIGDERSLEPLSEMIRRACNERASLQSFANGVAAAMCMPYETTRHQRLARLVELVQAVESLEQFKAGIASLCDLPVSARPSQLLEVVAINRRKL